jgi:hypothetical protein
MEPAGFADAVFAQIVTVVQFIDENEWQGILILSKWHEKICNRTYKTEIALFQSHIKRCS